MHSDSELQSGLIRGIRGRQITAFPNYRSYVAMQLERYENSSVSPKSVSRVPLLFTRCGSRDGVVVNAQPADLTPGD